MVLVKERNTEGVSLSRLQRCVISEPADERPAHNERSVRPQGRARESSRSGGCCECGAAW